MFRSYRYSLVVLSLVGALALALLPVNPAAAVGDPIAYGDTVSGEITNAKYFDLWEFAGEKGDLVQITMIGADGLDPYLGLIDGKTEGVLAEDDDSAGETNAYLEMVLPSAGTFIIVATRYDLEFGQSAGTYTLELQNGNSPQTTVISDEPNTEGTEVEPGVFYMGTIASEQVVNDTIDDTAYARLYEIDVTEGDELLVGMFADGSNLDSYLMVADETGEFLAEDDDSGYMVDGEKYDAYLSLTVPSTGTYIVVATRSGVENGRSSGAFAMMAVVEAGETPVVTEDTTTDDTTTTTTTEMPAGTAFQGELMLDKAVTGELDDSIYLHVYTFAGEAGQEVTITMTGDGTLDAYLGVMDASDEVIAEDNDSAGGTDAQIAIRLPEAGEYLVLATRDLMDAGKTSGAYTLQITEAVPEPPAEEETAETTIGGFGGLPGRSLTSDAGTFYLRGSGASDDPAKNSPIENFASGLSGLPGRGGPGALRPAGGGSAAFEGVMME